MGAFTGAEHITFGNYAAITQSDFRNGHYHQVPKAGTESEFWKRLMSLPSFRGLTQTKVAALVTRITGEKYGQTGVQKWKAGTSEPPVKVSRKLAAHDKYSSEWLISGQGDPIPKSSMVEWPFPTIDYEQVRNLKPWWRDALESRLRHLLANLDELEASECDETHSGGAPRSPPSSQKMHLKTR